MTTSKQYSEMISYAEANGFEIYTTTHSSGGEITIMKNTTFEHIYEGEVIDLCEDGSYVVNLLHRPFGKKEFPRFHFGTPKINDTTIIQFIQNNVRGKVDHGVYTHLCSMLINCGFKDNE